MSKVKLTLYSTAICHLCEQAEALLKPLQEQGQIELEVLDIVDHPELYQQYKTSIPVLATSNGLTLHWPFDFNQVCGLLVQAR